MELDRVYGGVPRFPQEARWSKRLALRFLREVPARREVELFGEIPTVAAARGDAEAVFVCADPEALVPEISQRRLIGALLDGGFDFVFPVSNESSDPSLVSAPAFHYVTPSDLVETAELMAGGHRAAEAIARADCPVYAARRSFLGRIPPGTPLGDAPRRADASAKMAVDRGAYVHRYGDLAESERADLAELIPEGSRAVLDVGCARGASARALRSRGVEEIVGIEPDAPDARVAATRYDLVVARRLEDVSGEDWKGRFDAVLFGDVLEHLEDPGIALEQVRPWLSRRGRVVASVPNLAHAAILADLLEGKFDYIPYSILSGTHVRFFTRGSLADLFESSGYVPERITGILAEPTPRGRIWQERLSALAGGLKDLASTELVIVARAAGEPEE